MCGRATVFPCNAGSLLNGAIPLQVTKLGIDPDFDKLPTVGVRKCVCRRGPTLKHLITYFLGFTSEVVGFFKDIDLLVLTSGILCQKCIGCDDAITR